MEYLLCPIPVLVRAANGTSGLLPKVIGENWDLISATEGTVVYACRPSIHPHGPYAQRLGGHGRGGFSCWLARGEKTGKVATARPIDTHGHIHAPPRRLLGCLVRREFLRDRTQLTNCCTQPVKCSIILGSQSFELQCLVPPKCPIPYMTLGRRKWFMMTQQQA